MHDRDLHERSTLFDRSDRFGWVSIVLHWLTAVVVIVLLFFGKTLAIIDAADVAAQRALHMSIGITAWLLIAARIVWRVRSSHPRSRGLKPLTHRLAKYSHYLLLAALSMMLISGPLMAWAGGNAIPVFGWFSLPGPVGELPALQTAMHSVHAFCGNVILWLSVLHVTAAFKHLMFHDDDSFARMLWPGREAKSTD